MSGPSKQEIIDMLNQDLRNRNEQLAAAQAEIAARDERIAELLATADAERKIVSRIWERLGSPKYEDLKGRSIYDLIDDIQQERDTARARVRELEAALENIQAICDSNDLDHLAVRAEIAQCAFYAIGAPSATTEPAPDVAALERAERWKEAARVYRQLGRWWAPSHIPFRRLLHKAAAQQPGAARAE